MVHLVGFTIETYNAFLPVRFLVHTYIDATNKVKVRGKVHPCTGTEALYRPYGP